MAVLGAMAAMLTLASSSPAADAWKLIERWRAGEVWQNRRLLLRFETLGTDGEPRRFAIELHEARGSEGEHRVRGRFVEPAALKGREFLSIVGSDVRRYLYVPWQGRARPLSRDSDREAVEGTDVTYGDLDLLSQLLRWTERDAEARLSAAKLDDGTPCDVVELSPRDAHATIRRIDVWFDHAERHPRRVELRSEGREVVRRIDLSNFQVADGSMLARRIEVSTPARGSRSVIVVGDVETNESVAPDFYDPLSLGH
jgi:hypothetical protein